MRVVPAKPGVSRDRTVGVVGAGEIGQYFVEKLVRDGWDVVVCDVDEEAVASALETGARDACETPAALAEASEVIVLALPGQPYVEAVVEGSDGVLEGVGSGDVVIDTGTTPPETDVAYVEACEECGAGYVDAGLTLGGPGEWSEETGPSINMFVGGHEDDYERVRPVIETLSYEHRRYGGVGVGHVVKAAHRMWQNSRAMVDIELYEYLRNHGVDPEALDDHLEIGFRDGYDVDTYPDASGFERALEGEDVGSEAGYRVDRSGARPRLRTSAWAKDTSYALEIARSSNTYAPILSTVYEIQLAAENYAEAMFDRELAFQDDDWHDRSDEAAVYRLMNRPADEWARLRRTIEE
jgi:3-hydroxyisobutyrate dehydrogenase